MKGNIGRQHTADTTLQDTYKRLLNELKNLLTAHDSVNGMIEKSVSVMKKFYEEIPLDEEEKDNDDDEDDDNDLKTDDESNCGE